MRKLISVGIMIIVILGCKGMEINRGVEENMFYSSLYPKLTATIDPGFKYVGTFHNNQLGQGKNLGPEISGPRVEIENHVFVVPSFDNSVYKLIAMQFATITPGRWSADMYQDLTKIEEGSLNIEGKEYKSFISVITIQPNGTIGKHLSEKGYTTHERYLAKFIFRITGGNGNIMMSVQYAEALGSGGIQQDLLENRMNKNSLYYLREFKKRTQNAIVFGTYIADD